MGSCTVAGETVSCGGNQSKEWVAIDIRVYMQKGMNAYGDAT